MKNKHNYRTSIKEGYITLMTMIVVGAVASAVAVSLLLLGLGISQNSLGLQRAQQSRTLAESCAEEALEKIRKINTFSGSGSIISGSGSCAYSVTNLGGENRRILASSSIDNVVRKIRVIIDQINPYINIVSWDEVGDF